MAEKLLSDAQVLSDFLNPESKNPFAGYGEPVIERDPDELEHNFLVDGWRCQVFAKAGGALDLIFHAIECPQVDQMNQDQRDQLQKGIDELLAMLRKKHGRRIAVLAASVPADWPPRDWP